MASAMQQFCYLYCIAQHWHDCRFPSGDQFTGAFRRETSMSISLKNLDQAQATALSTVTVAAAVKEAREAVGYSVDDLAVTCGLVSNEIVEIENGANADPAKLKRIAAALQVPVSAFASM
jgi:DNA-binding XRE family transcriptional regulator